MRTPWLLLALPGLAFSQFVGLSTSHDGRVLHFSTTLRQSGTQQASYGKIFRVTPEKGVELVREHRELVFDPPVPASLTRTSNFYLFGQTLTSGAGELTGHSELRRCTGPASYCEGLTERSWLEGRSVGGGKIAAVSSSGEFVLVVSTRGAFPTYTLSLYRRGDWVRAFGGGINVGKIEVADDGAFAFHMSGNLHIVTTTGQLIVEPGLALFSFLGGSLYLLGSDSQLDALDLASRTRRRVRDGLANCPMKIGLSGAVYQWCQGLRRTSLRGGPTEILNTEQAISWVLSRNERFAWYLSAAGEIKSVDLVTGGIRSYVGRTPLLARDQPRLVSSGGLYRISTVTLAEERRAVPPLPLELGGVRVRINGQLAALERVGPTGVTFQAPYEVAGRAVMRLEVEGASEFTPEESVTADAVKHDPLPVPDQSHGPLVVHGDWGGLVTDANPARPGEFVHFYLTGLSGLPGAPPLGTAAPVDRPVAFHGSVYCLLRQGANPEIPALVSFLGLAPGTVGYAQLSLQIPRDAVSGVARFWCSLWEPSWSGVVQPWVFVQKEN